MDYKSQHTQTHTHTHTHTHTTHTHTHTHTQHIHTDRQTHNTYICIHTCLAILQHNCLVEMNIKASIHTHTITRHGTQLTTTCRFNTLHNHKYGIYNSPLSDIIQTHQHIPSAYWIHRPTWGQTESRYRRDDSKRRVQVLCRHNPDQPCHRTHELPLLPTLLPPKHKLRRWEWTL